MTKKIVLFSLLCFFALNFTVALAEPTLAEPAESAEQCPGRCHK